MVEGVVICLSELNACSRGVGLGIWRGIMYALSVGLFFLLPRSSCWSFFEAAVGLFFSLRSWGRYFRSQGGNVWKIRVTHRTV